MSDYLRLALGHRQLAEWQDGVDLSLLRGSIPELVMRDSAVWLRSGPEPLQRIDWLIFLAIECAVAVFLWLALDADQVGTIGVVVLLGFALAAPVGMFGPTLLTSRVEARIGDGLVQLRGKRAIAWRPTQWQEPITAYAGLHAFIDRWTVIPPKRTYTDSSGNLQEAGGEDDMRRYAQGVLLLVHATNPRRSLQLARKPDGALTTAFAQGVAERLGLPLRWTH